MVLYFLENHFVAACFSTVTFALHDLFVDDAVEHAELAFQ